MSCGLPSPLPRLYRTVLRCAEWLVPGDGRDEWRRSWQAELWHVHHGADRRRALGELRALDLAVGVALDAWWLRTDAWRRAYHGTAGLCLASLSGLCLVAWLIALSAVGDMGALGDGLMQPLAASVFATPLIVFVTYATAWNPHTGPRTPGRTLYWVRRQLFFVAKMMLLLQLTFVLSVEVCLPLRERVPGTADVLQILFFVILTLLGLRWGFADQEGRCKECLRSLQSPERVGRPSHNLLEWNGTEQVCRDGHGLLSVPEMQTSWCESSRWTGPVAGWDSAASI